MYMYMYMYVKFVSCSSTIGSMNLESYLKKTSTAMQKVQFQDWKITLCSISLQKKRKKKTKTENCLVSQVWELAIQDLEIQDLACQINVLKIQD